MSFLLQAYPGDQVTRIVTMVVGLVAFIVLAAFVSSRFPSRRRAVTRSAIWLASLSCVLSVPLLAVGLEFAEVTLLRMPIEQATMVETDTPRPAPIPPVSGEPDVATTVPEENIEESSDVAVSGDPPQLVETRSPTATSRSISHTDKSRAAGSGLLLFWLAGVSVCAIRFIYGCVALVRLRKDVREVDDTAIAVILEDVCRTLGMHHIPRLVTSQRLTGPVATSGLSGPMVIFPQRLLNELNHRQLRDVLTHECAHLAQRDIFVGVLQRIAGMVYWLHPMVHILNRELKAAREEICDNHVLHQGDAGGYARTLVQLSTFAPVRVTPLGVCGMVSPVSQLERRVAALLDERRDLMTRTKRTSLALFGLVFLAMSVLTFGTRPAPGEDGDDDGVVTEKNDEEAQRSEPANKGEEVRRSEAEKKAIAAVEKLDGKVGLVGGKVVSISFRVHVLVSKPANGDQLPFYSIFGRLVTDKSLAVLERFPHLKSLRFTGDFSAHGRFAVTDAGMKHIAALASLETLDLQNTQVTAKGLNALKPLKRLKSLRLSGTKIGDEGMAAVKELSSLVSLDLGTSPVTARGLSTVMTMQNLKTLDMSGSLISDKDLRQLARFRSLGGLNLADTKISDESLKSFNTLDNLRELSLDDTKITDAGLKAVAAIRSLTTLSLDGTKISDGGLRSLVGLKNLRSLDLEGTAITDEGLKTVASFKNLTGLNLGGTKLTDAGLRSLRKLKNLRSLNLDHTAITDRGLKSIESFKRLTDLNLDSTGVTDAGLASLASLKQLRTLRLNYTKVTDQGLKQLKGLTHLKLIDTGPPPP